jgi:ubiquitin carboxyl-terminal hydrolase 14
VNNLTEGIKLALKDDREKNSEKLGRLAVFTGSSTITKLSPYMTVQMVRFFYKVQAAQKAEILRKVPASGIVKCSTQAKVGPVTSAELTIAKN